jgi:predicted trehalose synthase
MTQRSYADLADGPTTFNPEEQFDRDIDKALQDRVANELQSVSDSNGTFDDMAKAVLKMIRQKRPGVAPDLDQAIQDELEHRPASICKED